MFISLCGFSLSLAVLLESRTAVDGMVVKPHQVEYFQ
jgi:hypothetical protein